MIYINLLSINGLNISKNDVPKKDFKSNRFFALVP